MVVDTQIALVGITLLLIVIHDFYIHRDISWFFCNFAIRIAMCITFYIAFPNKWPILSCLSAFVDPYKITKIMEAYFEKFFSSKFDNKRDSVGDVTDSTSRDETSKCSRKTRSETDTKNQGGNIT